MSITIFAQIYVLLLLKQKERRIEIQKFVLNFVIYFCDNKAVFSAAIIYSASCSQYF